MRKVIYILMLVLSAASIFLMFYLPIFKFDDKIIETNYEEYAALASDSTYYNMTLDSTYSNLDGDSKKLLSKKLIEYRKYMHAVINNDSKNFYTTREIEILNRDYQEVFSTTDRPLSEESTIDDISKIKEDIKNKVGPDEYDNKIDEHTNKYLEEVRQQIFSIILESTGVNTEGMSMEELESKVKVLAINGTKYYLLEEFFLFFVFQHDDEFINLNIENTTNKGITISELVTKTVTNGKKINSAVFESLGENPSLFEKLKYEIANPNDSFYNPVPVYIVLGIALIVLLVFVRLIFAGIKGLKGHKRPRTLISSILLIAVGLLGFLGRYIITEQQYYAYHSSKFQCLLNAYKFSSPIIFIFIAISGVVMLIITIIGHFMKWKPVSKKQIQNKKF